LANEVGLYLDFYSAHKAKSQ